jgi:endogenous inhibitor of DNA gyrase (YacG/DUF329 family)
MTDGEPAARAATPCPICGRPADAATAPFCSKRCRMVDLGRWFSESYVVSSPAPGAADEAEEDGASGDGPETPR